MRSRSVGTVADIRDLAARVRMGSARRGPQAGKGLQNEHVQCRILERIQYSEDAIATGDVLCDILLYITADGMKTCWRDFRGATSGFADKLPKPP